MKNMCNLTTVLPHNLLQTNPCIRHIRHSFHVCRCTDTGGTRPLLLQHRTISFILLENLQIVCLQGVHLVPYQSVHENVSESLLHSLFLYKTIHLSPFDLVNRSLSAIVQTGDIYRIFHELQHLLTRLQHRYYDVTILMG